MEKNIEIYESLGSTNDIARERLLSGCCEWHTIAARTQSAGEGRLGRSFYSPKNTGLYMSTVLYPDADKLPLITGMAAVAVCEALKEMGFSPMIKWVNDIFIDGKKVCGILAKSVSVGDKRGVILGIGVNLYLPENGFPEEISDIAAYLFEEKKEGLFEEVLKLILEKLKKRYDNIGNDDSPEQYRKRCLTVGKNVSVIPAGCPEKARPAVAIAVDDSYHITVRYENGEKETLLSGEISVRI